MKILFAIACVKKSRNFLESFRLGSVNMMLAHKIYWLLYNTKIGLHIDFIFPWVCTLITHRGRQNMVRSLVTLLARRSKRISLFSPRFDDICALSDYRGKAKWNLYSRTCISGQPLLSGKLSKSRKLLPLNLKCYYDERNILHVFFSSNFS